MTPTIGQLWRSGRDRLAADGVATAALDARLLAQHLLALDTTGLIMAEDKPAPDDAAQAYDALIARRLAGEPVARIVGHKEFFGLDFALNAATLVPRPETEMLVAYGLEILDAGQPAKLLDLGTGTGCIALALLAHRPLAHAVGVDLAHDAVSQAQANAATLGLSDRFVTRHGSWFDSVAPGERFDLIVSNPPYIGSATLATLSREVRAHDPVAALDGGADGLDPYGILAAGLHGHLVPGGYVAFEIGFDQGPAVAALLSQSGLDAVAIHPDLSGHDRMVTARLSG